MGKIFFTLLIFFVVRINAQTWEAQNSGVNVTLRDVCFVDTLHGWAVGENATILLTDDGGKNWVANNYAYSNQPFLKVQFLSRNVGYVIGANNLILATKDGGKNWSSVSRQFDINFRDMSFINENEGWLTGYKEFTTKAVGLIIHTTDGGQTWEKQLENVSQDPRGAILFRAIKFKNSQVGWVLSTDGIDNFSPTEVFRTDNGGKSWNRISQILSPAIHLGISNDTLWCPSYNGLVVSIDGGYNWNLPATNFFNPVAVYLVNGLKGWVSTFDFTKNDKRLYYTTNLGITWTQELNSTETILGINSVANCAWLVGTNGLIMKKVSSITSVEINSTIPNAFRMLQNYPNPFNPATTINYQLPENGFVTIKVFDVLGKEIATLVNENKSAGYYNVSFDASKLTSGVYIYTINVSSPSSNSGHGFTQSKKMLLMK